MKIKNINIILQCLIGLIATAFMLLPYVGDNPAILLPLSLAWCVVGYKISLQYTSQEYAFAACSLISAGITADCSNLPTKGVNSTVYIGNFDEIRSGYPTITTGAVTAMKMAIGKMMYSFEGQKTSAKPKSVGRKEGEYEFVFDHEVGLTSFKIDKATFLTLEAMKGGKFFALITNNFTGTAGETKYKFYGLQAGMFLESMTYDPYDANTGGVSLLLKSDPKAAEQKLPLALWNTDLTTTEAIVTALLIAGV